MLNQYQSHLERRILKAHRTCGVYSRIYLNQTKKKQQINQQLKNLTSIGPKDQKTANTKVKISTKTTTKRIKQKINL